MESNFIIKFILCTISDRCRYIEVFSSTIISIECLLQNEPTINRKKQRASCYVRQSK